MLALMSTCRTSKTFNVGCITKLVTSFFLFAVFLFELFIFLCQSVSISLILLVFMIVWPWLEFSLFLWYLLGGSSVCWCPSKFTCVACSSFDTCLMYFAVNLDDSSFFANCLTLLAGNLSRSMLKSFIVLETNSSSLIKTRIFVSVIFLQFLGGTLPNWFGTELHYTICPLINHLTWNLLASKT